MSVLSTPLGTAALVMVILTLPLAEAQPGGRAARWTGAGRPGVQPVTVFLVTSEGIILADPENVQGDDVPQGGTGRASYVYRGPDSAGRRGNQGRAKQADLQKTITLEQYSRYTGYPDQVPQIVGSAYDNLVRYR